MKIPRSPAGWNLNGVGWAFTHVVVYNWHPLTMMSHMLDCQLYGLKAGGHHLTNIMLHTVSVILLFLVLRRMTGFLWRSAFVAAVFAIHPLRVESVAWVAERKDVLSGLFFMLTLWAYARYAQCVTSGKRQVAGTEAAAPAPVLSHVTCHMSLFYCLVLLFFVFGLMSKPMVVTLPFVLLLLDYWPLNRFAPPAPAPAAAGNGGSFKNRSVHWRLILEKIPLLALSGAACAATMAAQKEIIVSVPLVLRMSNVVVSYAVYIRQMVWPAGLAVLYPYPNTASPGGKSRRRSCCWLLFRPVFLRRQRQPYLLVGWLWYLGMLVPAIGLIQSGWRAYADRYTYLPQIGLYLLLTWAAADLCAGWRHRRAVLGGIAAIVMACLCVVSFIQTSYWRDSELLWNHALACTSGNAVAHLNIGNILFQKGNVNEAIAHYQKALQIKPDSVVARINLGNILLQKGNTDEAIAHYQKALQINPDSVEACYDLGSALLKKGSVDEAIACFKKALQINPDYAEIHNNLAWLLATCPDAHVRDGVQAVKYAEHACKLTSWRQPVFIGTLAAAYAESGQFEKAAETAQKACALASALGQTDLLKRNQELLRQYENHQPCRQP